MSERVPPLWKLNLTIPPVAVTSYLQSVGWPGNIDSVSRMMADPALETPHAKVDLPASDGDLLPQIGLEFFDLSSPCDPRRTEQLERLVALGLCSPARHATLRMWPGSQRVFFPGRAWPMRLTRWIDLKVTYHPKGWSAKAYLGMMPHASLF
jgi:hypothetical protein